MDTDKIYAEAVAQEYAPKDTSKVVALRKLDRKAKSPAMIFGYTFGVIAALLLGTGMCLAMKVIGNGSSTMMVLGIIVGLLGIAGMSVNPVFYRRILENGKKQYAADIIRLAKEIADEED